MMNFQCLKVKTLEILGIFHGDIELFAAAMINLLLQIKANVHRIT